MQLLARAGFRCEAFGSAMLDSREEVCIEHMLAECGLPYHVAKLAVGGAPVRMLFTRKGNVPVTLFRNVFTQVGPTTPEADTFWLRSSAFWQRTNRMRS